MQIQAQMKATLEKSGIAHKEIKVYGSQIMITCKSRSAAEKWGALVSRFATLRGIVESRDENADQEAGCFRKEYHKVWRVAAHI